MLYSVRKMKLSSLASRLLVLSLSLGAAAALETISPPLLEEDRTGALRALWIETGAGGTTILLGRVVTWN